MDTRPTQQQIADQIATIKSRMPGTYQSISDKATQIGNKAYELVRRGLRGEPNCFWAMEGGYVMGTPFSVSDIQQEVARYMVAFGCAHVCIFQSEVQDGVH